MAEADWKRRVCCVVGLHVLRKKLGARNHTHRFDHSLRAQDVLSNQAVDELFPVCLLQIEHQKNNVSWPFLTYVNSKDEEVESAFYLTVTDFARFRGMSEVAFRAVLYRSPCSFKVKVFPEDGVKRS